MKNLLSKNVIYHIFLTFLIFTQLIMLFTFLSGSSISNDDMCQLEVSISESLPRILELLLETDNNPPLFTLLAALWVRIVPYGSQWLKLLSQLFLVTATGFMGLYTKRIAGYLAGTITAVFTATSTLLVYCCADVFRPYGLLFLTGAVTLCTYLHRRKHHEDILSLVLYGVALTLMAYTHYFGILTCLALFLFDIWLLVRRQAKWQIILPYFAAGICYIPWLLPVLRTKLATAGSFWPNVPTFKNLYTNCYSKYFDSSINVLIFIIFVFVIAIRYYKHVQELHRTKLDPVSNYPKRIHPDYDFTYENLFLCLWVPFFVTILDFIYSGFLNPAGSMWVERYFIVLYPFSFLLIGVSWSYLLGIFIDRWEFTLLRFLPYLGITAFLLLQGYQFYNTCDYVGSSNVQPFEQACDYLVNQEDFFDEATGFIPTFNHQKKAYRYFFTHDGARTIPTIQWLPHPIEDETILDSYQTLYLLEISNELDETTKEYIEMHFEPIQDTNELGISKWIRISE